MPICGREILQFDVQVVVIAQQHAHFNFRAVDARIRLLRHEGEGGVGRGGRQVTFLVIFVIPIKHFAIQLQLMAGILMASLMALTNVESFCSYRAALPNSRALKPTAATVLQLVNVSSEGRIFAMSVSPEVMKNAMC
jgi:hypothetical protein